MLLVDGVTLLRPEERVFTAMLTGFANQQLARDLARTTVEGRENAGKMFTAYVNTYPWDWTLVSGRVCGRRGGGGRGSGAGRW